MRSGLPPPPPSPPPLRRCSLSLALPSPPRCSISASRVSVLAFHPLIPPPSGGEAFLSFFLLFPIFFSRIIRPLPPPHVLVLACAFSPLSPPPAAPAGIKFFARAFRASPRFVVLFCFLFLSLFFFLFLFFEGKKERGGEEGERTTSMRG